eukprot:TRINITY_DN7198_c0_g1_i2.p1 TRINITY_DN7198_c0_g1~~TRINITY_DN7198_c0_g1_i2.p1  ORF type:complete len:199 (-),score=64.60 TRINITY_DN7198_c0_g1_i2:175-771(-)
MKGIACVLVVLGSLVACQGVNGQNQFLVSGSGISASDSSCASSGTFSVNYLDSCYTQSSSSSVIYSVDSDSVVGKFWNNNQCAGDALYSFPVSDVTTTCSPDSDGKSVFLASSFPSYNSGDKVSVRYYNGTCSGSGLGYVVQRGVSNCQSNGDSCSSNEKTFCGTQFSGPSRPNSKVSMAVSSLPFVSCILFFLALNL